MSTPTEQWKIYSAEKLFLYSFFLMSMKRQNMEDGRVGKITDIACFK